MTELHGVFPYLVSPVDETAASRRDVLARLADDLIAAGVHGLTPLGSTGEFAYLPMRAAHRHRARDHRSGRRPRSGRRRRGLDRDSRRGGAGAPSTPSSAPTASWRFSKSYFPLADAQVEAYFRAIADAVDIPVVLYTNPQFQRSDLSLDVIARLAEHPRIRYIKDASTNTGPACCRS